MPTQLSSTLQKRLKPPAQVNFCKELAKSTHKENGTKIKNSIMKKESQQRTQYIRYGG
jgi:hypothetical protein